MMRNNCRPAYKLPASFMRGIFILALTALFSQTAGAQQVPAAYWRAAQAMGEGDYPTARRLFSTMLLGKNFYFNAYWRTAQCYVLEGQPGKGRAFFENLLTQNAPAGEVYSALAFLAEMRGDRKQTAEYCWQAAQNQTAFLSIHQKLIDLAPAHGLEQQVREHLTNRAAKNSNDWPAQFALAYWETLRGRPEVAMAQFAGLIAAGRQSWRIYFHWAVQLMIMSKLDSSQFVIDRGLAAMAAMNDKDGEGQLLLLKGHLFMRQGRSQVADSILARTEKLSRAIGYLDLQVDLAATLSGLRFRQGRLQQALVEAKRAEVLSARLNNAYGRMQAHHYAADAYRWMGLYEKAIAERTQAYQLACSLKNESNRQLMANNLAAVYQAVGEHQRALPYFEEAILFARKYQQTLYLASYLRSWAVSLVELNRLTEAKKYFEEALSIARKNALKRLECDLILNLAGFWQKRDDWRMANNTATEALALARRAQLKNEIIDALVKLGEIELRHQRLAKAEERFREAQRLSAEAGFYVSLIASMTGLGKIAIAAGNNQKAANILSEAATLASRRIFSELAAASSSLLPLEKELFFALSRAYIRLQQPEKALEVAEQMRDLVVRRRLQRARLLAHAGLADGLRQQAAHLDTLLLQKRLQLANLLSSDSANEKKTKVQLEIAGLELRQNQLWEKFGARAEESLDAHANLNLNSLQQALAARRETAMAYFVGDEETLLFALNGDTLLARELPVGKQELRELVSKVNPALHAALQDSQSWPLISPLLFRYKPQTAFQLYQILLADFVDPARAKQLLIIADEYLHFLPFEILLQESFGDTVVKDYRPLPFVLKNYTVRYASSLQAAFTKQLSPSQTPAAVFALAPSTPEFDDGRNGAADLWQTEREVLAIEKILGKAAVEISRPPFSAGKKWRDDLQQYPILHFAAHSEAQNAEPLSSRIIFDERENGAMSLYAFEIFAMHFPNGRLAFLSSCNTASGVLRGSEGLQGFVQAFRAAGIPSVIGSLWPAEAEASSRLAAEFYRRLRAGETAAAALRQAKLSLLESDKPLPFFWAAFQYYGIDQTFQFQQHFGFAPFLAVVFIALIIGATLRRRMLRQN